MHVIGLFPKNFAWECVAKFGWSLGACWVTIQLFQGSFGPFLIGCGFLRKPVPVFKICMDFGPVSVL